MYDQDREDAEYHFYAKYDYLQEAYGAEARQLDEQNANERQCGGCGEYISAPDVTCGAPACVADHEEWLQAEAEAEGERRAYAAADAQLGTLSAAEVDFAQHGGGELPF